MVIKEYKEEYLFTPRFFFSSNHFIRTQKSKKVRFMSVLIQWSSESYCERWSGRSHYWLLCIVSSSWISIIISRGLRYSSENVIIICDHLSQGLPPPPHSLNPQPCLFSDKRHHFIHSCWSLRLKVMGQCVWAVRGSFSPWNQLIRSF